LPSDYSEELSRSTESFSSSDVKQGS
jgi:hypothetical protein